MEWLGHRESATARHYYHLHHEETQRQMKRLDFLGEAGVRGPPVGFHSSCWRGLRRTRDCVRGS